MCLVEPEVVGLPKELVATEGQSFTFPSHVTGKPEPDVYWYLNSKYVVVYVITTYGQCAYIQSIRAFVFSTHLNFALLKFGFACDCTYYAFEDFES